MQIKVCGMREEQNIEALLALQPDYIGFIFYEKSPRYVGDTFSLPSIDFSPTKKVGVFVNHSVDFIFSQVRRYALDLIQLHGKESPTFCEAIKSPILRGARDIPNSVKTIKAFGIDEHFDFGILEDYAPHCDYFLFDTKTSAYGGSGAKFTWDLLNKYHLGVPFFLSGGLDQHSGEAVIEFKNTYPNLPLFALDLNSRFEISPALKNTGKLEKLIHHLR